MRIIHTADWHLGKIVNGFSLLEDQTDYFDKMLAKLADLQPDVLVMAGDLYDRSNPPKEAVTLANHIFTRLINDLGITTLVISGNHDSPERVEYGNQLLAKSGLYIEGIAKAEIKEVVIDNVHFWLVPFIDPATARHSLADDTLSSYEDVARVQIETIKTQMDTSATNILIYHGFLINKNGVLPEESDSERPLTIGMAEYVPVELMDCFDYVMLGHLHKGQMVGRETVRYSGSPLKYSKSEATHNKAFDVIDIHEQQISRKKVTLTPLHDMRVLRASFAELMQDQSEDYVFIELTDDKFHLDAINQLRTHYPNIMEMHYINLAKDLDEKAIERTTSNLKQRSTLDLFSDFYQHYSQAPLSKQQKNYLTGVISDVEKEENY